MEFEEYFRSLPFQQQLEQYIEMVSSVKALEENRKVASKVIIEQMHARGSNSERSGDFVVTVVKSTTSRIDKNVLLSMGVSPEVISKATVQSTYEALTVRWSPRGWNSR